MMAVMAAWADEPLDDREFPDGSDLDDDDVLAGIVTCPDCCAAMHEDSPQCPHCKQWVSHRLGDWRSSRKWYVRGGRWVAKGLLVNWPAVLGISVPALFLWLISGC